MDNFINIFHDVFVRLREESEPLYAIFDDDLEERVLQALNAEQVRFKDSREILEEWNRERKKKHKAIYRWLIFIRKVYWEIEHVTKACKPKRHNKHLSWIATGTYYHYLSSDDEDSNHSNNAVIDNGQRIDQFIHRTQKMVA